VRTTVRLDDEVLAQAKQAAARSGRTLTAVIEDALRESFARSAAGAEVARPPLPTFGGRGLQPGIDLDDTAALIDAMESGDR
jgi:hypothetical protein